MNEYDGEEEESLFINFHCETRLTRVVDNVIIPTKLSLRADVEPDENADEADLSHALAKIRYFFDQIVIRSIAFSADNAQALDMFVGKNGMNRTGNLLMTVPGEPNDEVLATVFQAKMNALANGAILFSFLEVKSDNLAGLSFMFVGDARNVLPPMEDWIGERSYFDKPWWSRNDASTLDTIPVEGADLSVKPSWAYSLDNLAGPKQESGIVVRPAFQPTVLSGGKDDKDA